MDTKRNPLTRGPKEGKTVSLMGATYRILVSGDDTQGAFATIDMLVPPGGGPGPHAHADFAETFYVVDGEVMVQSEAGSYVARKGAFIYIPKGGIVHYFKNRTDKLAHLLCTVVPAGLEKFFEEAGQPVNYGEFRPNPPMDKDELKKLQEIAARHGQQLFPPDYFS